MLVPIDKDTSVADLAKRFALPLVIVARAGLGTINHTLLTVAALRDARLDLRGVVMIGKENRDNRRAVEVYGNVPVIGCIPWLEVINRSKLRTVFAQNFDAGAFS